MEWHCDNTNATQILTEVKQNEEQQSVYWIEKNTVFFNSACLNDNEDLNLYNVPAIYSVYIKAYDYQKEHTIEGHVQYPSIELIE